MTDNNATLGWLADINFNEDGLIPAIAQDHNTGRILMMAWMSAESLVLTANNKVATYYSRSRQRLWRKGETSGHTQKVHSIRLDCDADTLILSITQVGGIACHTGRESCFYKELTLVDGSYNWQDFAPVLKDPSDIYNNLAVADNLLDSDKTDFNKDNVAKDNTTPILQKNNLLAHQVLTQLDETLQERKNADTENSYVASLYKKGLNKILEKVGEESVETIIAAKEYQNYIEHVTFKDINDPQNDKLAFLKNDLIYEIADVWFHTLVTLAWFDIGSEKVLQELARRLGLSGIEEKNIRTK